MKGLVKRNQLYFKDFTWSIVQLNVFVSHRNVDRGRKQGKDTTKVGEEVLIQLACLAHDYSSN